MKIDFSCTNPRLKEFVISAILSFMTCWHLRRSPLKDISLIVNFKYQMTRRLTSQLNRLQSKLKRDSLWKSSSFNLIYQILESPIFNRSTILMLYFKSYILIRTEVLDHLPLNSLIWKIKLITVKIRSIDSHLDAVYKDVPSKGRVTVCSRDCLFAQK